MLVKVELDEMLSNVSVDQLVTYIEEQALVGDVLDGLGKVVCMEHFNLKDSDE